MATLEDLVRIRGQRALRLRDHLVPLAEGSAWDAAPWLVAAGRSLDDVYIEPDVTRWNRERQPATVDDELRAAIAPRAEEHGRVRWPDEWRNIHRAVVQGRPGEGKTTLLQRTCREVATASLAQWETHKKKIDEIPVPIWIRAEDIIGAGSVSAALGIDPVAGRSPTALSANDLALLLASPLTWLFVDALDEWPSGARAADAIAALATLCRLRARVVLSVRSYAWPQVAPAFDAWRSPRPYGESAAPRRGQSADVVDTSGSEPATGRDGLAIYELAPLTRSHREDVVERWCGGDERRSQLTALLDEAPIRELTSNALLLTLLCAAATADPSRRISADTRRVELYAWLVADLVGRADKIKLHPNSDDVQDRVLALARAAWRLWTMSPGAPFQYQDWVDQLSVACRERELTTEVFREIREEVERSGLLVTDGPNRRFFPQTAYEYLAGAGLVQDAALRDEEPGRVAETLARHADDTTWREVSKLAIGHLAVIRSRPDIVGKVVESVLDVDGSTRGPVAALIGEALVEVGEQDPRLDPLQLGRRTGATLVDGTRRRLIAELLRTMENADAPGSPTHVPAVVRARAGAALGWIGDPRFDREAFWLPVATSEDPCRGFVLIPDGRFRMGSDKLVDPDALDTELPQREVIIKRSFLMARWPVTVAQFSAYLRATGVAQADGDSLADPPTCPVRWVSAVDAEGYCAWLTAQLRPTDPLAALGRAMAKRLKASRGVQARLPTEAEWEYVARGGDEGRIYPWGRAFNPNLANCHESGIGTTSAVGSFGGGMSRWGIEELSGNVQEVTASGWRDNYNAGTREDWEGRVIRCGSFDFGRRLLRSAVRYIYLPGNRNNNIGFRVAVSPFRS